MCAASKGNLEMVDCLLSLGASIDYPDGEVSDRRWMLDLMVLTYYRTARRDATHVGYLLRSLKCGKVSDNQGCKFNGVWSNGIALKSREHVFYNLIHQSSLCLFKNHSTPLMYATSGLSLEVLKWLLEESPVRENAKEMLKTNINKVSENRHMIFCFGSDRFSS